MDEYKTFGEKMREYFDKKGIPYDAITIKLTEEDRKRHSSIMNFVRKIEEAHIRSKDSKLKFDYSTTRV